MYDIVALGELLVDFIQEGINENGQPIFSANPGGAPCNVLAMASKIGKKTAFIGKVGKDSMGLMLEQALASVNIDMTQLKFDDVVPTTLAFVAKTETGDRKFSFYRNPGADMMLDEFDVDEEIFKETKAFHFGTLSMTHVSNCQATYKAVQCAKINSCLISFDPNIREALWGSMENLRKQMIYGMENCDILKISDNEIEWFTGEKDFDKAIGKLKTDYDIPLIFLTLGKDGSRAYYKDICVTAPAFYVENPVDTTGAGDTFMGVVLSKVLDIGMENLNYKNIAELLNYANMAASMITMKKGALKSMPEKIQIENRMK